MACRGVNGFNLLGCCAHAMAGRGLQAIPRPAGQQLVGRWLAALGLLMATGLACDIRGAEPEERLPPALHLRASWPEPWAGMDCAVSELDSCGVDIASPIELRFDRYLLPSSAVRQSLSVMVGPNSVLLATRYDPLERVLRLDLPVGQHWRPGTRYDVELIVPDEDPQGMGLRAFDGAPLSREGSEPLRFSFRTRRGQSTAVSRPVRPTPNLEQVLELLGRAGCAQAVCHQSQPDPGCSWGRARLADGECTEVPRMGLDLDVPDLARTGLRRVARQTEFGARTGEPLEDPSRFGVSMPLVDGGRPSNSYLLYKLLVAPSAYQEVGCATQYSVAPLGCPQAAAEETARLREWFVLGEPMPVHGTGLAGRLDLEDLRSVGQWILSGAPGLY